MAYTVQAWGVFRDGKLVSSANGVDQLESRRQADVLNKFNGANATYSAQEIRGKRLLIEEKVEKEP